MTVEIAIQRCIERVLAYDHVSIAELRGTAESCGIPVRGDVSLELSACPNCFLWAGMSDEFYAVLDALMSDSRMTAHPCTPLVYLCDGAMLTWPIAKRPPKAGYKSPHWAPVVFRRTTVATRTERLALAREALLQDGLVNG